VRSGASDKALLAVFAALAVASVGLKSAVAAPSSTRDADSGKLFQQQVIGVLTSEGFRTSIEPRKIQSSIIHATRGNCRLTVRDARAGKAIAAAFARDAREIGTLQYWYKGSSYQEPPGIRLRIGYFEANSMKWAGRTLPLPIPLALARSSACGAGDFGLADIRIPG
jgi:hypothetical protein